MSLAWLIGVPAVLLALWILAQDPTIRTFRRRIHLNRELRAPSNERLPEDPVAVLPTGGPKSASAPKRGR